MKNPLTFFKSVVNLMKMYENRDQSPKVLGQFKPINQKDWVQQDLFPQTKV